MESTEGRLACLAFKHPQGPNLSLYNHYTIFQRYLHPRRARPLLSLITVCEGHSEEIPLKGLKIHLNCEGEMMEEARCGLMCVQSFSSAAVSEEAVHFLCSISKYQLIVM